jgi:hypothetical protein
MHRARSEPLSSVPTLVNLSASTGNPRQNKENGNDPAKLPFRERARHFTWTWFTMCMATGGIANLL